MDQSSFLLLNGENTRKFLESTKDPKISPSVKTSDRNKVKTNKYIPPTKEGKSSGPPVKKRRLPPPSRGKSIDISGVKQKKPSSDIDLYCKRLRDDTGDVSALAGLIQACLKDHGFKNTKITNAKALARVILFKTDDDGEGVH